MSDQVDEEIGQRDTGRAAGDSAVVEFSADPELWSLARLVVTSIASRLDFALDAIDDLRFGVDELCTLCATGAADDDRIRLEFVWGEEHIEVRCQCTITEEHSEDAAEVDASIELSMRVLGALTDEYELPDLASARREGSFKKFRPELD